MEQHDARGLGGLAEDFFLRGQQPPPLLKTLARRSAERRTGSQTENSGDVD